jgi:hypothetical protein
VSKAAAQWNSHCVSAAWNKWQAIAVEARRRRAGRRRAELIVSWRWKRRGIRAALSTWQDLVHVAKCVRRSAKTVKRWRLRRQYVGVAAVMSAWELVALKTRRLQRCGQSVMRTWLRLRIGAAFAGWKAKMLHRKRLLHATMRLAHRRVANGTLALAGVALCRNLLLSRAAALRRRSPQSSSPRSAASARTLSYRRRASRSDVCGREGLFIERTSPLATTKPSTRKPARLAII